MLDPERKEIRMGSPRTVLLHYPAEMCSEEITQGRDPRDAVENNIRFAIMSGRNIFHQLLAGEDLRLNHHEVDPFPIDKGRWSTIFRIGPGLTRLITANREDASEEEVNDAFLRGLNLYRRFEDSEVAYLLRGARFLDPEGRCQINPQGVLEAWDSRYRPIQRLETPDGTVYDIS